MNQGKDAANKCVSKGNLSKEAIDKVYENLTSISDLSLQISFATEQQSIASQDISRNIITISELSNSNFEQVNIVDNESQEIGNKAKHLASLGKSFIK